MSQYEIFNIRLIFPLIMYIKFAVFQHTTYFIYGNVNIVFFT